MPHIRQFDNFPAELRRGKDWLIWGVEAENSKRPYRPLNPDIPADKTNPDHCSTYEEAVACVESGKAKGVGRSNFGGTLELDVDNGLVDDKPEPWALELINGLTPTYCERSPSGKGFHLCWSIDDADSPSKSFKVLFAPHTGAEVLVKGSYITVTGDVWGKLLPLAKLPKNQIDLLCSRVRALKPESTVEVKSRHDDLNNTALKMITAGRSVGAVVAAVRARNKSFSKPKPDSEVERILSDLLGDVLSGKIICRTTDAEVKPPRPPAVISTSAEFATKEFREMEVLLEVADDSASPVLHHPTAGEIHAWRGTGKSHFSIGLLNAIATAGNFLAYRAPKARRVLAVDGEMSGADTQEILRNIAEESENFNVISVEEQPDYVIPSIAVQEGCDWIEEAVTRCGAEVVSLDNWSTLANIGTNEEEAWQVFMSWVRKMRLKGVTVWYLHHDGKGGKQRGHSKPEDLLNWVIQLKWKDGYEGAEGLKCEMHFEKSRRPVKQFSRLEISLVDDHDEAGKSQWVYNVPGSKEQTTQHKTGRKQKIPSEDQVEILKKLKSTTNIHAAAKELGVSRELAKRWLEEVGTYLSQYWPVSSGLDDLPDPVPEEEK